MVAAEEYPGIYPDCLSWLDQTNGALTPGFRVAGARAEESLAVPSCLGYLLEGMTAD